MRKLIEGPPVGQHGPWRLRFQARRSVMCPGDCGYMATEFADAPDARSVSGVCTKCGYSWVRELTDEGCAEIPADPRDALEQIAADGGVSSGTDPREHYWALRDFARAALAATKPEARDANV